MFEVAAGSHALTTLASFDGANGGNPVAALTADAAGNLYGTTAKGGANGGGTVFEVAAATHALTTLASLVTTLNGAGPSAGVTADAAGNLYGTTTGGGAGGDGTVFEVAAGTRALTTLATFDGANGAYSSAGLTVDAAGNLYGTTTSGGATYDGTVFEVAAGTHTLTTLAAFDGPNGNGPAAGLTADAAGDLYGTTVYGGSSGDGTVFEVAAGTHALTTLATFNGTNGAHPYAVPTFDAAGDLYGTTEQGGVNNDGTVFELAPAVPEPASAGAAAVAGLTLLHRRRRRAS